MFRCLFQPRSTSSSQKWLPSLTNFSSGSRGLKLSDLSANPTTTPREGPGLRNGKYWKSLLRQNNIGSPGALQTLKNPRNYRVTVRAAPQHVRKVFDDKYLGEEGHAFAEAVVRRYLRHHRERPLWVFVRAISADQPIIKGKFRVRAIAAWRQALRNAGYDANGESLAGGEGRGSTRLFGTVEISSPEPLKIQDVAFEDMRAHFERVVKVLKEMLAQSSHAPYPSLASATSTSQTQRPQQPQRNQNDGPRKDSLTRGSSRDSGPHHTRRTSSGRSNDSRDSQGSGRPRDQVKTSRDGGRKRMNTAL
ncbi:unnamed protein product [Discula destructiva]